MDFGIWCLPPPLIIILVAIATRNTILSLLLGTVVCCVMQYKPGFVSAFTDLIYEARPVCSIRRECGLATPGYANFLITNGSIIFPVCGQDTDDEAVARIKETVGVRYNVIPVNARGIALNGGSIHCFTQQVLI